MTFGVQCIMGAPHPKHVEIIRCCLMEGNSVVLSRCVHLQFRADASIASRHARNGKRQALTIADITALLDKGGHTPIIELECLALCQSYGPRIQLIASFL
jgi:hypothetical protein